MTTQMEHDASLNITDVRDLIEIMFAQIGLMESHADSDSIASATLTARLFDRLAYPGRHGGPSLRQCVLRSIDVDNNVVSFTDIDFINLIGILEKWVAADSAATDAAQEISIEIRMLMQHYERYCRNSQRKCVFTLENPASVIPSKAFASDSGYDLTLISLIRVDNKVCYYSTGVIAKPPPGYYFTLHARSSLPRYGYMLANSVGIIDQSYRGAIIAALVKFDNDAADLPLPGRYVQLVPHRFHHLLQCETQVETNDTTARGAGGFGSSGV